jgi:hypothetical protein
MTNSRILTILGAIILIGDQSSLATAASRHHHWGAPASAFLAIGRAADGNPLADRAATLGGQAFTVERAEGVAYNAANAASEAAGDKAAGNPLNVRAATLGGQAFTAERAEGASYKTPEAASVVAADEVVGNPVKDRAETLGGKVFTVERESGSAVEPAEHFLAEFQ